MHSKSVLLHYCPEFCPSAPKKQKSDVYIKFSLSAQSTIWKQISVISNLEVRCSLIMSQLRQRAASSGIRKLHTHP